MKLGILAGGLGSRLSEETVVKPKPMVEVGSQPILWHIMKIYAHYGIHDFAVALGYRGDVIKRWAIESASLAGDLTVNLGTGQVDVHEGERDAWRISLIETGAKTGTGGRIRRLVPHLTTADERTFCLTWGDGVADIDIRALLDFHRAHGKLATLTAVRPPARFGHLELAGDRISEFSEKPQTGEGWINGAFFVLEREVADYIDGDATMFEKEPLERLAKDGQLMAYRHEGFWQCMDTIRDKKLLDRLWEGDEAPWKVWG